MSSIAPAGTTEPAAPPGSGPARRFDVNLRASGIYLAFAAIVVIFDIMTHGLLLTPENVSNLIVQNSYILVLAIGMILVIIAGHIDLSAGSVVAVTGAIAAVLMVNHHMSWPLALLCGVAGATLAGPLALLITLIAGAAIGAFQGYWVAYFGLPAFIVTLAGMLVFRALTMTVLGNQGIGPFPNQVRTLSTGFLGSVLGNVGLGSLGGADLFTLVIGVLAVLAAVAGQWRARMAKQRYGQQVESVALFAGKMALMAFVVLGVIVQLARYKNLPWVLVLLTVLVLGYSLVASRTVFGRHIYAIGGNAQAAVLSGVKVKKVTFWIFVNMGVLAAIAGVVFAGRLNQAGPTAGTNFELDAIAAAFIGGAAVTGGVGKVVGAITGGLIMGVINNGMSLLGEPSERVMLVKGLILLAAVAFDVWAKRRAGAAR